MRKIIPTLALIMPLVGCSTHQAPTGQAEHLLSSSNIESGASYEVRVYVVAPSDTIDSICRQFCVSNQEFMTLNPEIGSGHLKLGQTVRVSEGQMIPASMNDSPEVDVRQVLDVYAKLTSAKLDIDDGVRQSTNLILLPRMLPAMTRVEALDFLEDYLFAAGINVTHPDDGHVVFRLRQ